MQSSEQLTRVVRDWAEVFMHRSMHDFKRFMDTTGLSFSQISILMRLVHGGSMGITEIADTMGVTSAAASQSIDRLVQIGLITRAEDPDDRRAKRLELAYKGRALVEKGIETRSKWIEHITKSLTSEQQDMIITALTLLTNATQKLED